MALFLPTRSRPSQDSSEISNSQVDNRLRFRTRRRSRPLVMDCGIFKGDTTPELETWYSTSGTFALGSRANSLSCLINLAAAVPVKVDLLMPVSLRIWPTEPLPNLPRRERRCLAVRNARSPRWKPSLPPSPEDRDGARLPLEAVPLCVYTFEHSGCVRVGSGTGTIGSPLTMVRR